MDQARFARTALASAWQALQMRARAFYAHSGDRRRHLVHRIGLCYLLVVPVLLAVLTAVVLFANSDVNVAMLYSQCHARARMPVLSRLPLVGAPACFLVSFFQEALAPEGSARAFATMSGVLSFVASLLTVSTVEAARICNGPSVLIAYPMGPWLVFDLMGGAMVWQLLILPAFFRRSQQLAAVRDGVALDETDAAVLDAAAEADGEPDQPVQAVRGQPPASRHLAVVAEVVAIPVAVALGYVVPALAMLLTAAPVAIAIWLFFPVYVALVRRGVRVCILRAAGPAAGPRRTLYLERHAPSLLAVYAVPLVLSVLSHGLLVWRLLTHQPDDRQEMTRSTLRVVEIDVVFILLTVLYWVLVEAGWRVVAVVLGVSVLLGPGAGLCLGWIYRERQLGLADEDEEEGDEAGVRPPEDGAAAGEETPLLH